MNHGSYDARQLTGVDAEDLDAWEGSNDADPEADHVRHGRDGDGYGRVLERGRHAFGNGGVHGRATPRSQHHEGVVNADA